MITLFEESLSTVDIIKSSVNPSPRYIGKGFDEKQNSDLTNKSLFQSLNVNEMKIFINNT